MTITNLNKLRCLLEEVEKEEGVCYKRHSECSPACPLWMAGEFGTNICLSSVLGRRVQRIAHGKKIHG